MKLKTIYICTQCQTNTPRWSGQCSGCSAWNTLIEDVVDARAVTSSTAPAESTAVADLLAAPLTRIQSGLTELDRVLGGGIVPGSLILLGGEPGIGKSTLTLQLAAAFATQHGLVVLASGEESASQIALRAKRTGASSERLHIVSSNDIDRVVATAEKQKPALLIVDSVQVMGSSALPSAPGSVPQIRVVAERLLHFAKGTGTPVILIGHVTKDGELAGPQVLAHLVDTVLDLSGDPHRDLRLLRTTKNRFGSTSEVGVFEMTEQGLTPVANPSEAFLAGRAADPVGSCITATVEGTRPLLLEVQALTCRTSFGYPRRTASGFDLNRTQLLLAVLQRHAGLKLESSDVFVNVVGGLKLSEPAADLAVCLAVASSMKQKPLPLTLAAWGEVGLSGEIRAVSADAVRRKEAKKLGFEQIASRKEYATLKEAIAALW